MTVIREGYELVRWLAERLTEEEVQEMKNVVKEMLGARGLAKVSTSPASPAFDAEDVKRLAVATAATVDWLRGLTDDEYSAEADDRRIAGLVDALAPFAALTSEEGTDAE